MEDPVTYIYDEIGVTIWFLGWTFEQSHYFIFQGGKVVYIQHVVNEFNSLTPFTEGCFRFG